MQKYNFFERNETIFEGQQRNVYKLNTTGNKDSRAKLRCEYLIEIEYVERRKLD